MTLIVQLIAKYALWIYILCAIGMIYYLQAALSARNEGAQAMFSLEREQAAKRIYRSAGMILVLLLIVVGVYALTNYAELPPAQAGGDATITPDAVTLTVEAQIVEKEATGTATVTQTPESESASTPTAEPTPTRKPRLPNAPVAVPTLPQETPAPQVAPAACPHPNVQVQQPGREQVIDAGIEVRGTAYKEGFDRYEFKFQSRDFEDEWHWVETFRTPVLNGDLGWWQTAHLPNGNYRFMLIAIDKTGNSQECVVPVVIQH